MQILAEREWAPHANRNKAEKEPKMQKTKPKEQQQDKEETAEMLFWHEICGPSYTRIVNQKFPSYN